MLSRNNGNRGRCTGIILMNGKEIHSATEQRHVFTKYFEDLSVPKDQGYDSAYIELWSVHQELIADLCRENMCELDPITTEEVTKETKQLYNKKATEV